MEFIFGLLLFVTVPAIIIAIIISNSGTSTNNTRNDNDRNDARDRRRQQSLAEQRGVEGEYLTSNALGKTIPGIRYKINDIIFKDNYGNSCQIDHIIINENGIWVVETKNYIGKIMGKVEQKNWTQVINFGQETHQFYNPVKQNQAHIDKLKQRINLEVEPFNVVVFVRSDISDLNIGGVYTLEAFRKIINYPTSIELLPSQMERIYNRILNLKLNSGISAEEHKQSIENKRKRIQDGFCPRCGGRLVMKNGQYGKFYSCCHYPQCTFTIKNIDE